MRVGAPANRILLLSLLPLAMPMCHHGGVYLDGATCTTCAAGYGCPRGVQVTSESLAAYACGEGQYQDTEGSTSCIPCPRDTMCPSPINANFVLCGEHETAEPGSAACTRCGHPDFYLEGEVRSTPCRRTEEGGRSMKERVAAQGQKTEPNMYG